MAKKVTIIERFRGTDYSTIYEVGETYTMEDARANSLALRGLVKILSEIKEETVQEKAPEKQEEPAKEENLFAQASEKAKRGRPALK